MPSFLAILKPLVAGTLTLVAVTKQPKAKLAIDQFFMGVFRDLGRYKARKRRMGNSVGGLMPYLLKKDDPFQDMLLCRDDTVDDVHLPSYTIDELYEMGSGDEGSEDNTKILIGILGHVYDVSSNPKFYGKGGKYGHFAGFDVTYALSTGCQSMSCVQDPPEDYEFTEKELLEGQRWLSFFHLHDKYPLVGKIESDVDWDALLRDVKFDAPKQQKAGERPKAPILM